MLKGDINCKKKKRLKCRTQRIGRFNEQSVLYKKKQILLIVKELILHIDFSSVYFKVKWIYIYMPQIKS